MPGTMNFNAKLAAAACSLGVATMVASFPASGLKSKEAEQSAKTTDRIQISEAVNEDAQSRTIRDVSGNVTIVIRAAR